MKSTQVGTAILSKEKRKRREKRAALREGEKRARQAKTLLQTLTESLAAARANNPTLAAIDARAAQVVNPRVKDGGKQ